MTHPLPVYLLLALVGVVVGCDEDEATDVEYEVTCEESGSTVACTGADGFWQDTEHPEFPEWTVCEWDCGNYDGQQKKWVQLRFERDPNDCWMMVTYSIKEGDCP